MTKVCNTRWCVLVMPEGGNDTITYHKASAPAYNEAMRILADDSKVKIHIMRSNDVGNN